LNNNTLEYPGSLFIIAAPSGAGKTSLVDALIQQEKNIVHSISYTTRPMRPKEQQGVNYFFVSKDEFIEMIAKNLFLEFAEVFGHYYGTSREFIETQLKMGNDIILEIDWQGAEQIKQLFPNCVSIFILPPSRDILQHRLQSRQQDHPEVIEKRMAAASSEMTHYAEFDYLIVNDQFDEALDHLHLIVGAKRLKQEKQALKYKKLLADLLEK